MRLKEEPHHHAHTELCSVVLSKDKMHKLAAQLYVKWQNWAPEFWVCLFIYFWRWALAEPPRRLWNAYKYLTNLGQFLLLPSSHTQPRWHQWNYLLNCRERALIKNVPFSVRKTNQKSKRSNARPEGWVGNSLLQDSGTWQEHRELRRSSLPFISEAFFKQAFKDEGYHYPGSSVDHFCLSFQLKKTWRVFRFIPIPGSKFRTLLNINMHISKGLAGCSKRFAVPSRL